MIRTLYVSNQQNPTPDINQLITAGRAEYIANQTNTYDNTIKPYLLIIQKLAEETAIIAKENEELKKKIPKNRAERRKLEKKKIKKKQKSPKK